MMPAGIPFWPSVPHWDRRKRKQQSTLTLSIAWFPTDTPVEERWSNLSKSYRPAFRLQAALASTGCSVVVGLEVVVIDMMFHGDCLRGESTGDNSTTALSKMKFLLRDGSGRKDEALSISRRLRRPPPGQSLMRSHLCRHALPSYLSGFLRVHRESSPIKTTNAQWLGLKRDTFCAIGASFISDLRREPAEKCG
jgi:hypothetical protein